jgi:post-segregation antitoxin (ccd killing protein)
MKKRRQVSVRGVVYDRLKREAKRRGISISVLVEQAIGAQAVDSPPGEG